MIPYGRQTISSDDIKAVNDVLASDWLTQGPAVVKFEQAVADYCGVQYSLSVCNATAALHLACRALGLGTGDILWTSPNTFLASANCALYCGASVDFVDIDPLTYNLCHKALALKLEQAKLNNCLPKIIVPVHFAGMPCDMQEISRLAKLYGCFIIEDASHAIGADYLNEKIGSCRYSDITVFSFHPVKIITTGEGGMALTHNKTLHQKLLLLRSHGMTRDPANMSKVSDGAWYYEQMELGYNYRLTDLQAALGLSQLTRLDEFIIRRRYLAERYNKALSGLPVQLPLGHSLTDSAWHLYVIQTVNRAEVFDQLRAAGIGVNVHYIPVHSQPYYQQFGFKWGDFPKAEQYYNHAITLPLYFTLSEVDQDYVIEQLRSALEK